MKLSSSGPETCTGAAIHAAVTRRGTKELADVEVLRADVVVEVLPLRGSWHQPAGDRVEADVAKRAAMPTM